jgi:FKBP-type peptidyl-prolyl cis-trans isomerase 2
VQHHSRIIEIKDKMKDMAKIYNKRFFGSGIFILVLVLFTSCIKDDSSEKENESRLKYEKMLDDNLMTRADSIGYGVYMKLDKTYVTNDTLKPVNTDLVILTYSGYSSDGTLLETSDSSTAQQAGKYFYDQIYGPKKVRVASKPDGIFLALLNMPLYSKATIVMPADMAYQNYEPVKYIITLHKIIKNEIVFEKEQRMAYLDSIAFGGTYNSDSTFIYRINKAGTSKPEVVFNSKVTIKLRANFAEWINEANLTKNPGRQFFPINKSSDKVVYFNQYSIGFPLTPAIDSMVAVMKIGEEREFIVSSDYAYGETGFLHPDLQLFIVPRYTSVHYKVELVSVE